MDISRIPRVEPEEQSPHPLIWLPLPPKKAKKIPLDIQKFLAKLFSSSKKSFHATSVPSNSEDKASHIYKSRLQHQLKALAHISSQNRALLTFNALKRDAIEDFILLNQFNDEAFSQLKLPPSALSRTIQQLDPLFLFKAIEGASSKFVHTLLTLGFTPHITDEKGNTPLHIAIALNKYETFKRLLPFSNHLNPKNKQGFSPYHYLYYSPHPAFHETFSFAPQRTIALFEQTLSSITPEQLVAKLKIRSIPFHYTSHLLFPNLSSIKKKNKKTAMPPPLPPTFFQASLPIYLQFSPTTITAHALADLSQGQLIAPYSGLVTQYPSIDNSLFGNETRFITKSPTPNLSIEQIIDFNGVPSLALRTLTPIPKGVLLTL